MSNTHQITISNWTPNGSGSYRVFGASGADGFFADLGIFWTTQGWSVTYERGSFAGDAESLMCAALEAIIHL